MYHSPFRVQWQGFAAYNMGYNREDNPYDYFDESEKYRTWDQGWVIARDDDVSV